MSDLTITLEGSEVRADFFGTNAWLRNDGTSTIYAGRKPGVVSGADGVVSVPAGGSAPVYDAHGTVYLIGTGSVQLIGSDYSENPFKSSAQGGSGADEVARAAIEAHAGNSAIHLTAEQINGVDGGKTVEKAAAYTLDNAVDYPLVDMRVYGKSTQDGVPTPDAPVDIVSIGDSGEVGVTACGKNLIPFLYMTESKTINGLTFVVNSDGSIKVSGTCTDNAYFNLCRVDFGDVGVSAITNGYQTKNGLTFSPRLGYDSNKKITFLRFFPNETIDETFYPQIEKGSTATAYEPYIGSTASLTSALPLCGIPVTADGNYTDSNGQQWICDELIYNADGTGKVIKNTIEMTFDGSDDERWCIIEPEQKQRIGTEILAGKIKKAPTTSTIMNILCNRLVKNSAEAVYCRNQSICVSIGGRIDICITELIGKDLSEWTTYLASNPMTVVCQLAEPQEIDLTAAEMAQLEALQTFDGITNISNDKGAEMRVKYCTNRALSEYVKPIKTGLQKQIDELKTAVLSLGGNV